MKNLPNFKIVILEDDDFYNKLLSRFLEQELKNTALIKRFTVEINSYTSFKDCSRNFDNNTTLLFTDYYLRDGYSASHMIDFIKYRCSDCKVVVLSQVQTIQTSICTILQGAYEFIVKDKKTLFQCKDLAETIILEKLILKD